MMKKKLIITTLMATLPLLSAYAQKRNNIKFGGIAFDNMFSSNSNAIKSFTNKFGFSLGYQRNIGSCITIGLLGNFYLPFTGSSTFYGAGQGYNSSNDPNLKLIEGEFTQSGYIVGYETKYYFEPFDDDGATGGYIGMNAQFGSFSQQLSNVKYLNSYNYTTSKVSFPDQTLTTNRIGIKIGVTNSNYLTNDYYFSVMYNFSNNISNQQFLSPTTVRAVSIGFGWTIGIPY